MSRVKTKRIIAIVGPTASGKSSLGIELAKKFDGEIVNGDSRQIYRSMNIGTDKPHIVNGCVEDIPHHLFDVADPVELLGVAEFQHLAYEAIDSVLKRGKLPILVGGSGYYVQSVVEGWEFPRVIRDQRLRQGLEHEPTTTESLKELFDTLAALDPATATIINRNNKRRLIRAIEIAQSQGARMPLQRVPRYESLVIGIQTNRDELYKKIDARIDEMLASGLEKEVRELGARYGWTPVLRSTIDYAEWEDCLGTDARGKISHTTLELIRATLQRNHRALVKKQMTWFRKQKHIRWIENLES
ncbi:MAG: tRNA dimethylallyltransferase [Parcubacteria group bacterium GW2011_GWA2_47_8]|nr:MAG: tRNA dimethylallyltransferase [Parcubacteria group bacterium GW2011_GWA2_47_8]OHB18998.1 MAG: tRNA (adenosine(37)-N6)-dimethylallyltransferase MiaA [Parcubacteria group bacterium RIFCSPHIGHO2_01_FULL_47_10b]